MKEQLYEYTEQELRNAMAYGIGLACGKFDKHMDTDEIKRHMEKIKPEILRWREEENKPVKSKLDEIVEHELHKGYANGRSGYRLNPDHREFMDDVISEISKRVATRYHQSQMNETLEEIIKQLREGYYMKIISHDSLSERKESLDYAISIIKNYFK